MRTIYVIALALVLLLALSSTAPACNPSVQMSVQGYSTGNAVNGMQFVDPRALAAPMYGYSAAGGCGVQGNFQGNAFVNRGFVSGGAFASPGFGNATIIQQRGLFGRRTQVIQTSPFGTSVIRVR